MFVPFHIHARSAKHHPFHLQAEPLFGGVFASQLDSAAGSQNPMPRQPGNLPQDADDLPGGPGPSGSPSDPAIGCDGPPRQRAYALNHPRPLFFRFRWLHRLEKIILLFTGIRKD